MLTVDPSHVVHDGINPGRVPADLAIVVPTFNEATNIPILVEKLETALLGHAWEIIFVDDDSPDRTAEVAHRIGRTKPYVRCIQRIGRRGLSSAVIEGVLSANAPYVAVMDADLQHDEAILVPMLRMLENKEADVVVGSRYVNGGSVGEWSRFRHFASRAATNVSSLVIRSRLSDPMSGFFMFPRDVFVATSRALSGNGYKILFDLLASSATPLKVAEIPYCFRPRLNGVSKLDAGVIAEHAILLLTKSIGRYIPVKAILLAALLIGNTLIQISLLSFLLSWMNFSLAQLTASIAILTGSYLLPFLVKRRDADRKTLVSSLLAFYLTSSVGLIANLSVSGVLFAQTQNWWLAGGAGAVVGALWDYMYRTTSASARHS